MFCTYTLREGQTGKLPGFRGHLYAWEGDGAIPDDDFRFWRVVGGIDAAQDRGRRPALGAGGLDLRGFLDRAGRRP
jgi:hypothetical protein